MVTIAVCEDESHLRQALEEKLTHYFSARALPTRLVGFPSGEALLASPEPPDVALMDIRLGGLDGMAAVRRLRDLGHPCQVIFLTAYPQYVFNAFDLDAVHYLVKPVPDEALFHAVDRAIGRLPMGPSLAVTAGTNLRRIPFRDILCCEVMDHTSTIHTLREQIGYAGTLGALEHSLDERFYRCHHSFLVNLDHIADKGWDMAVLSNGARVPISRRRQKGLTQALLQRTRNEVL